MKVLFTGTTSSGKSTLINELKKKDTFSAVYIEEMARKMLHANPAIEQEPTFQDILFRAQVQAELVAQSKRPKYIMCDRGVLDNIAHAMLFGQEIKQEWIDWCQTYDQIYLFNKEDIFFEQTSLQEKMIQRDWRTFRDDLDNAIKTCLTTLGCEYEILSGTVEQRMLTLETYLNQIPTSVEGIFRRKKEGR